MGVPGTYGSMPEPSSTVAFEGRAGRWPADWEIRGWARGLCDWTVTVPAGGPPFCSGDTVNLRLSTPLGPFEGRAIVSVSRFVGGGLVETNLVGAGPLAFAGAP